MSRGSRPPSGNGRIDTATAAAAAVALVALAGVAAAVPAGTVLVVADAESGERLLVAPVGENTTVALEYTHSVERTPVRDVYAVRGDRLAMTRTEFESYGWGFPAGANVTRENGSFVARPDRSYAAVTVKPGRIAGHELVVGDRRYDLVGLSDARAVRMHVTDRSTLAAVVGSL